MNVTPFRPRIVTNMDAVAPEMLDTLRKVRDWMDGPDNFNCPIPNPLASQIRVAVAKAEQRSKRS